MKRHPPPCAAAASFAIEAAPSVFDELARHQCLAASAAWLATPVAFRVLFVADILAT